MCRRSCQRKPGDIRRLADTPSHDRRTLLKAAPLLRRENESGLSRRLIVPSAEHVERLGVQRDVPGPAALRGRAVHGDPAALQIDTLPGQREQLAAAHAGVQREEHQRLQVVGECGRSQVGQQLVIARGAPRVRRIALPPDPLFAIVEGLPQPGLFVRRQEPRRAGRIDLGALHGQRSDWHRAVPIRRPSSADDFRSAKVAVHGGGLHAVLDPGRPPFLDDPRRQIAELLVEVFGEAGT